VLREKRRGLLWVGGEARSGVQALACVNYRSLRELDWRIEVTDAADCGDDGGVRGVTLDFFAQHENMLSESAGIGVVSKCHGRPTGLNKMFGKRIFTPVFEGSEGDGPSLEEIWTKKGWPQPF